MGISMRGIEFNLLCLISTLKSARGLVNIAYDVELYRTVNFHLHC